MTRRILLLLALAALAALAGCSTMAAPDSGPGDVGTMDASIDARLDAASDHGQLDLPDVPPAAMHTFVSSIGPLHLDVGQETTMCIIVRLANDSPQYLRTISAHLGPTSHHLIFYRATETTEQPTPFACRGFSGVRSPTNFDSPLLIAQQSDTSLSMPPGIGMRLDTAQMVRIELHAINITSAPVDVRGDVTLDTVDQTVPLTPADILFWGNAEINLPPHAMSEVHFFHVPWGGLRIFGVTSHTHSLGTLATISIATDSNPNDGTMAVDQMEVHRSTNWSDPPLTMFDPPLQLSGDQGFHLVCHYNNTTDNTVTFGEGFYDEMCFMWAYYWPAPRGTQGCVQGFFGGSDAGVLCWPP